MSDLALPPHLRGRLHNDWPFPFKGVSRGWNAKGPREPKDSKDYAPWPPKLVEGKGVCRWESAGGQSIVFIPEFEHRTLKGIDIYDKGWTGIEMNPGSPNFLQERTVYLTWENSLVYDLKNLAGNSTQHCTPDNYSPSALQKFSKKGWMKLEPFYHSEWRVLKKRELPVWPETGEDTVLFWRRGARPDHVDSYYNRSLVVTGGLHWE